MSEPDSYRILGVAPGASLAELKRAYRRLVKKYHPDSADGSGNARVFSVVVKAYQRLAGKHGAGDPAGGPAPGPRGAAAARRPAEGESTRARKYRPQSSRLAAAEGEPREPPDLFSLGRTLLLSREPRERAAAARALGGSRRRSSYAFLRKALWDRDTRVLTEVVRAIAELDVRQSAGELGSLFSRTSPAVRGEILRAVTRMGAPRGFESLVRMGMRDPDRDVRSQAAKALGSWQASQEGD